MIKKINLERETVLLDSEKKYTGMDNPEDIEKLVRKAIGLPITKQLIYYSDKKRQILLYLSRLINW